MACSLTAQADSKECPRLCHRLAIATRLAAGAATRLVMYRAILMGVGLGLNLIALGAQALIWALSDDELQKWCESCAFGKKRDSAWSVKKQHEAYFEATYAVGM